MAADREELNAARREFEAQSRKVRRWQIIALPLLAACLIPLAGFFWFALAKPCAEAREPLTPALAAQSATVRAAGDLHLAGKMDTNITAHGLEFPFYHIADFLGGADFSFATLETALADSGTPLPGKPIVLRAAPSAVESLLLSGLDMLNLAANHMMDYDTPALEQTLALLDGVGIAHIGAGLNEEQARRPYIQTAGDLRIAYLGYCENAEIFYSYDYPRMLAAGEEQAGIASLRADQILADIESAKANCDVVVLNLHWGEEFSYLPQVAQQELAHRLIDGGADIIVGHHPHCLQSIEVYNNGLIIYSLGNLAYAQNISRQTRESAILELELTSLGWQNARLYPLLLTEEGQPQLAEGEDITAVYDRLTSNSTGFEGNLKLEGNRIVISR